MYRALLWWSSHPFFNEIFFFRQKALSGKTCKGKRLEGTILRAHLRHRFNLACDWLVSVFICKFPVSSFCHGIAGWRYL